MLYPVSHLVLKEELILNSDMKYKFRTDEKAEADVFIFLPLVFHFFPVVTRSIQAKHGSHPSTFCNVPKNEVCHLL